MHMRVLAVIIPWALAVAAEPRFESEVLPVLKVRCLACHSAKVRQAGLSVETRDDLLTGGKSGPAVVPGRAVQSPLLAAVATGKMPMGGPKLSEVEILLLRQWIEAGALRQGEDADAAANLVRKSVKERDVQAILSAKCWVCHGRRAKQASLDLRTRESILKGGKAGPAVVPGDPEASLLVKRIVRQEMPPPRLQEEFSVRGLTDDELAKVKEWIAAGARADGEKPVHVDFASDRAVTDKDRAFWSFQPPRRPAPPTVRGRTRNAIDAFVLEKLEAKGLALAPEAGRRTLARRAWFALTGLPPTPEEMAAFLNDSSPRAYEALIDRLLESPHYGERWAQPWLDAVGYADSEGGTSADSVRPHAWRYRDYVIRSLNAGKPFDRFLTEQIAGDELFDFRAADTHSKQQVDILAATGFWRMAPDSTYSTEQNFIPERMDVIANQIEVFGSAVLGLTINCARCHDHKFDPIPQRDYYRLVAMLTPAYDPYAWLSPNLCLGVGANCADPARQRHILLKEPGEVSEVKAHNEPIEKRVAEFEKQRDEREASYRERLVAEKGDKLAEEVRQALLVAESERTAAQKSALRKALEEAFPAYAKERAEIEGKLRAERNRLKPVPRVRALFDLGPEPPPARILLRGEHTMPGDLVEPGTPSVLSASLEPYRVEPVIGHSSGRRLALARWLTQPNHPLTARVMVNRVWQQHFGEGLVASAGNFGRTGTPPSNQALLDWLATEFVQSGWDLKALHRLIMTSATYRQTSGEGGFPLRRLDSDALRDAMLRVAGRLDAAPFGPADKIKIQPDGEVVSEETKKGLRRSIYVSRQRTHPMSLLETFDSPFLNPNCVRRQQSTVASQPLELLNSDLARSSSRYMAGRVIDQAGDDPRAQIERAYLTALARPPTAAEMDDAAKTLEGLRAEWERRLEADKPAEPVRPKSRWLALAALCHTLMNSAEFLYIE